MYQFDLVTEPWVPVVTPVGRELVSLRDCLTNAHNILGLSVESPLETVALFRQVLLPVYLDALFQEPGCRWPRSSAEWAELWQHGHLDVWPSWAPEPADRSSGTAGGPIDRYLSRYRDRFQVFGECPFAQVGDLRTPKGETKPASVLIASAAAGNNVPLFSARTEADPPVLTPAEAIRAVLATQCWDTAGIKTGAADDPEMRAGKTTGNPTGPLGAIGVVLPLGRSLAETLLLHIPIRSGRDARDRPQWRANGSDQDRADQSKWCTRPALGLLDLLTWQARRVRLVPESGPGGQPVIRQVVLTAGDRLHGRTPQEDPHTAWRMSKAKKEQVPVRHTVGQAAWRGMLPMLATRSDTDSTTPVLIQVADLQDQGHLAPDYPLRVLTVGVQYGNQSAVVEELIVDQMPLPVAALNPDSRAYRLLESMVTQAEELRQAANRLGDDLRLATGGEKLPWDRGQRIGDQMVHEFTPIARRALAGLQREPHRAEEAEDLGTWATTARRVAFSAVAPVLNAMPPEAFLGRAGKSGDHRASLAEVWYRGAVNKILGAPAPSSNGTGGT